MQAECGPTLPGCDGHQAGHQAITACFISGRLSVTMAFLIVVAHIGAAFWGEGDLGLVALFVFLAGPLYALAFGYNVGPYVSLPAALIVAWLFRPGPAGRFRCPGFSDWGGSIAMLLALASFGYLTVGMFNDDGLWKLLLVGPLICPLITLAGGLLGTLFIRPAAAAV